MSAGVAIHSTEGVTFQRLTLTPEACSQIAENTVKAGYAANWRGDGAQKQSHHKALLRRHMENGTWDADDSVIVLTSVDPENALAPDGLHRLFAAAASNIPLETWAIVGLDVGEHYDKGKTRNLTQRAKRHEFTTFTTDLIGAARNIVGRQVARELDLGLAIAKSAWVTEDMVLDFVREHEEVMLEYVKPKIPAKWGIPPAVVNCVLVELALTGYAEEAQNIKGMLKSPTFLEDTDADNPLARFVSRTAKNKAGTNRSVNSNVGLASFGKVIPKWMVGETLASWSFPSPTNENVRDFFLKPVDASALQAITGPLPSIP